MQTYQGQSCFGHFWVVIGPRWLVSST